MIRFGLCCLFIEQPIKFRTTTATSASKLSKNALLNKINDLCLENATSLMSALEYCSENGIGCFRIMSGILPLKTHPTLKYEMSDLPDGDKIIGIFKNCGIFAKNKNIRTCFHPDQFVVLNSKSENVVEQSLIEIEYQAEVAEWVGADVLNIHGGGAFNDKKGSLSQFEKTLDRLSDRARSRITVENDDKTYTPSDLLPICKNAGIPLVYDVHHHRCNKDDLSVEEATELAISTWNREPMFHISSPIDGWEGKKISPHHNRINVFDFPENWKNLNITVEVEAKDKELAVKDLMESLNYEK